MKPFKKYILKNGLRIILVPQQQSLTATALVLVETGSKYETKNINGVSHFLEHICFKGTKKRPTNLIIASELESMGASYNAFTGQEYTGYYAKARAEKVNNILDIVSDIYLNQVVDEKEVEKERGAIIEELNMYEDHPMRRVGEIFMQLVYGDQPAGWDIGGTKETVGGIMKDDILKYRNQHYVAKATTVIVAGAFNEKKILADIKKIFAGISTAEKFDKNKTIDKQESPAVALKTKKVDQTHIVMGFRAFDMHDKRRFALEVLGNILGGGMSSRLFQRVREQMGAAYYVNAGADLFTDHGTFAVSAGLNNEKLETVVKAILEEFKKISTQPVTDKELRRSKDSLTGRLMIGLEVSDELASFYGQQELFHKDILTPKNLAKKIEAVTAKDVLKVAKDIMKNEHLNLAMIAPFEDKKPIEKILKL